MATPKIVPRANGEGGLGISGKGWGSIYLADTTTSTANTGAIIELSADDGAPMGDSHRLGVIYFKGAEDSSGTLVTGARIEALTDAAWTNVENGCALYFYTTDGNASETNVLKLDSNKKATFAGDVLVNGDDITLYDATNDGNPTINLGSAAANRFEIQAMYDGGSQRIDQVNFTTYTDSTTPHDGRYLFYVDEVELVKIADNGLFVTGGERLQVQSNNATLVALDLAESSATQGGKMRLLSGDGAAMADGHRLGIITFEGAEDASGNYTVGAQIESFCEAAWSSTENGTRMVFSTTDGNASTSTVLTLDSNKIATFAGNMRVNGAGGVQIIDPTTSSATEGGHFILASDDGARMNSGDRLGIIEFKGAEDNSNTITTGASISAVTEGAWGSTTNPCGLHFKTTAGDAVETTVLSLSSGGDATFTKGLKTTGASVTGLNYRTIYVDAGSMVPSVTNGASAGTEEASSNDVMNDYFAFDTSTDEYVQFKLVMPEQWDGGTVKAKFYWKPATSTTTSHDCQWGIQATAHADGGVIDSTWGTAATAATDNVLGTAAGKVHVSAASGACTIAGSPAEGELVYFRVFRDVSGDDLNEDAHLLGVNIQYRESATASAAW